MIAATKSLRSSSVVTLQPFGLGQGRRADDLDLPAWVGKGRDDDGRPGRGIALRDPLVPHLVHARKVGRVRQVDLDLEQARLVGARLGKVAVDLGQDLPREEGAPRV